MHSTQSNPATVQQLSESEFSSYEQTRYLYEGSRTALLANVATCTITAIALWAAVDKSLLAIWYGFAILIAAIRFVIATRFFAVDPAAKEIGLWKNLMLFSAFITSLPWIFAAVAFVSTELYDYSLIVTSVFVGLLSACVLSWSSFHRCFLFFAIPSVSVFVTQYALTGTAFGYSVALLLVGYVLIITTFVMNSEKAFLKSASLLYENTKLADEMTRQKNTAENAVKSKNQFIASASHDLRQPLHAAGLFVSALENLNLDNDAKVILDKLSQSTYAINNLLHGLLDISRLDANVVEYRPKNIDLYPVLQRLVGEYQNGLEQAKLNIELVASKPIYVVSDELLVERVIRNLIDNAVKFTSEGRVVIEARNSSQRELEVLINDTGPGIPKEQHDYVFSEFGQLMNPERDRRKGLGLGLAIVKRLCDLMGVSLTLKSEVGQGTQFTLKLLIPQEVLVSETVPELIETTNLVGKLILVIDDEVDILDGMRGILEPLQANVITALDAEDAIEQLQLTDLQPDVIVADFRLRDNQNGIDAIRTICEEFNSDIRSILVTGDTSPDRLALAKSAGMSVLHKPVSAEQLTGSIQELLVS